MHYGGEDPFRPYSTTGSEDGWAFMTWGLCKSTNKDEDASRKTGKLTHLQAGSAACPRQRMMFGHGTDVGSSEACRGFAAPVQEKAHG